ncbi:MAG: hydantoinase/carbamoylase family amidase, partial [Pseudomonadota bacterium]
EIDGIASVVSRAPGNGPFVLAGSHLESQNRAGWLDGALGVVYALEAARAVHEAGGPGGVDVIAFADEEGHFGHFLGSFSYADTLAEETIDNARNRTDGTPLRTALATAGLEGTPRRHHQPGRHKAFLEAHIEQGLTLDGDGLKAGIVTSIVAIWQFRVVAEGAQNHAGTTSMARRRDAGAALRRVLMRVEDTFPAIAGPASVWTVGRITMEPGDPSIIPGRAEALLQFRDADPAVLDRLHAKLAELVAAEDAAGPCTLSLQVLGQTKPAMMDETVQTALDAAAARFAPAKHIRMPSGAGHDAQNMAPLMPSGMLFVPSIGGISHHWTEDTAEEDIALGAQIYVDAVARLLAA